MGLVIAAIAALNLGNALVAPVIGKLLEKEKPEFLFMSTSSGGSLVITPDGYIV